MATEGTTFPGELDEPIDVTLVDEVLPDHINTVDARVRAVEAKIGADASIVSASLDYRTRHLALATGTMTTDGDYVTLWELAMADGTAATIAVDVVGVRDGANEALGVGLTASFRRKGATSYLVGAVLVRHDQRATMTLADVALETTSDGVRLRVKSSLSDRVHWSARGTVVTARPGGM